MKKTLLLLTLICALLLAACQASAPKAPQVLPTMVSTLAQGFQSLPTAECGQVCPTTVCETPPQITQTPCPTADPVFYELVVLADRYYTLLGHGGHEQAWEMWSAELQENHGEKAIVIRDLQTAFDEVEIVRVTPYPVPACLEEDNCDVNVAPYPSVEVVLKAWGKNGMSGSQEDGAEQTQVLTFIEEDDVWKIDAFATGYALAEYWISGEGALTATPTPIMTEAAPPPQEPDATQPAPTQAQPTPETPYPAGEQPTQETQPPAYP